MYKPNLIGPWPNIDPSASWTNITADGTERTFTQGPLVWLPTNGLGSTDKAFLNVMHTPATVFSMTAYRHVSFGVCLKPLQDVCGGDPVYVDVSMVCKLPTEIDGLTSIPFIGFIDTPSAAIGTGWDANNVVSNFTPIPGFIDSPEGFSLNTQVLLKSITSASLDTDKFLCLGIMVQNHKSSVQNYMRGQYMVSARYHTSSISTYLVP